MSTTFFLKEKNTFFFYGSFVFWLVFSFYSLKDLSQGFTNFFYALVIFIPESTIGRRIQD